MGILRSKLYELEQEKRANALDELRGPKHEISFGNQIRNYVLYPYQMVKDLRSGVEDRATWTRSSTATSTSSSLATTNGASAKRARRRIDWSRRRQRNGEISLSSRRFLDDFQRVASMMN